MEFKKFPEDFIVEEVGEKGVVFTIGGESDIECNEKKNSFLHFTLIKKNWTTIGAIGEIARRLRINTKRFGWAGNKDRRAVSSQRVSMRGGSIERLRKLKIKDIRLKDFSYSSEKVFLGNLYGNRFTIRLRNCKVGKKELEEFFRKAEKNGLPNYFGKQRFSVGNAEVGENIINRNFEEAVKIFLTSSPHRGEACVRAKDFLKNSWGRFKEAMELYPDELNIERKVIEYLSRHPRDYIGALRKIPKKLLTLIIASYQSRLFNDYLKEYLKKEWKNEELCVPGFDIEEANETLSKEGIDADDFIIKEMPDLSPCSYKRNSLFYPESFKFLKNLTFQFILRKGIYATVLLKFLDSDVRLHLF